MRRFAAPVVCALVVAGAAWAPGASPANVAVKAKVGPGFHLTVDNRSSSQIGRIELVGEFRGSPLAFAATSNFLIDESARDPAYSAVHSQIFPQRSKGVAVFDPRTFDKRFEAVWANKCVFDVRVSDTNVRQVLYPGQNLCASARIVVRDDLWALRAAAPQAAAAPPPAPRTATIAHRALPLTPGSQDLFTHGFYAPDPVEGRIGYHIESELRFPREDFASADCGGVHVQSYSAQDLPPGFRVLSDGKLTGTGRQPGDWTVEVTAHEVACGAANNNFGDRTIEVHVHVKP